MSHIKSRKHRKYHHKLSKTRRTRRTRKTRRTRGGAGCVMCKKPYDKDYFTNGSYNFCDTCIRRRGSVTQSVPHHSLQQKSCYGCLKKYVKADFTKSHDYCDKCVHKTWEQVQRSRSEALAKLSNSTTKKD